MLAHSASYVAPFGFHARTYCSVCGAFWLPYSHIVHPMLAHNASYASWLPCSHIMLRMRCLLASMLAHNVSYASWREGCSEKVAPRRLLRKVARGSCGEYAQSSSETSPRELQESSENAPRMLFRKGYSKKAAPRILTREGCSERLPEKAAKKMPRVALKLLPRTPQIFRECSENAIPSRQLRE